MNARVLEALLPVIRGVLKEQTFLVSNGTSVLDLPLTAESFEGPGTHIHWAPLEGVPWVWVLAVETKHTQMTASFALRHWVGPKTKNPREVPRKGAPSRVVLQTDDVKA